jgi:hypothetical protein
LEIRSQSRYPNLDPFRSWLSGPSVTPLGTLPGAIGKTQQATDIVTVCADVLF